jgi:SnoaL-like domain
MPESGLSAADLLAIHSAVCGFFTALDRFDDEAVAALMAPAFEWVRADNTVVREMSALRQLLAARSRKRVTRHLVTNVEIHSSSVNEARVHGDILVFEKHNMSENEATAVVPGPSCILSTSDEVVRFEGRWRIARKQARAVFKIDSSQ